MCSDVARAEFHANRDALQLPVDHASAQAPREVPIHSRADALGPYDGQFRQGGELMSETVNETVLRPGQGRSIDLGNFQMSVKATGDITNGFFSLLEAEEPPNFGPPLHIHHDADEAFYVLSGEYIIFVDGRNFTCPAGSFIFIPKGMTHGFRVGSMPSRKLNLYTPAAMV